MKVSIITVCYNSAATIRDTIESVLAQNYANIEYIIIDGASSDNTLEIVNEYIDHIGKVVSEPDNGIYDAMNKGIKMASGDLVGILNSDDFYKNSDIIKSIVDKLKSDKVDSIYGDLIYVDPNQIDKINRYWKSGIYNRKKIRTGWMPPHPTFFVKKEIYEKYGYFNLNLKSAADYELMLRFLYKHEISSTYLNKIVTVMRDGGKSNYSLKHRLFANNEDFRSWSINNIKPAPLFRFLKPLRKLPQYFVRPHSY